MGEFSKRFIAQELVKRTRAMFDTAAAQAAQKNSFSNKWLPHYLARVVSHASVDKIASEVLLDERQRHIDEAHKVLRKMVEPARSFLGSESTDAIYKTVVHYVNADHLLEERLWHQTRNMFDAQDGSHATPQDLIADMYLTTPSYATADECRDNARRMYGFIEAFAGNIEIASHPAKKLSKSWNPAIVAGRKIALTAFQRSLATYVGDLSSRDRKVELASFQEDANKAARTLHLEIQQCDAPYVQNHAVEAYK